MTVAKLGLELYSRFNWTGGSKNICNIKRAAVESLLKRVDVNGKLSINQTLHECLL